MANSSFHFLFNNIPGLSRMLSAYVVLKIADPVLTYFKGGKILDIGSGSGVSAHFWGAQGGGLVAYQKIADVYGVEVSDRARSILTA